MKKTFVLLLFLPLLISVVHGAPKKELPAVAPSFKEVTAAEVNKAFEHLAPHPRLLLTPDQMQKVRDKVENDPVWNLFYQAFKKRADSLGQRPVLERKVTGRRLLSISRQALHRLATWGFIYQFEKDKRYAERAEKEMLALANFEDWHPKHFLDTAEMTMAVAIGYDACYDALSSDARQIIRDAILTKGVGTSLQGRHGWMTNNANWNQVCHAGMLYGALAIAEDEPDLARQITLRSVNGVTWSMASYEPDGTYTEGPGYWDYGTSFNIMLITGLESAIGTDFGRGDSPGLLKTIRYFQHVAGPTGKVWNYPDSGGGRMFAPTAFWFAHKMGDPGVTFNENRILLKEYEASQKKGDEKSNTSPFYDITRARLTLCALLWGPESSIATKEKTLPAPKELGFVGIGNGLCPVVLLRTDWNDPNAAWLGIKAGTPRSPHGHADSGAFVYEKNGVRWAIDLGPESYHKIEELGMSLWSSHQAADRWKLFRYNNFSHNTLTINDTLQRVTGKAVFTETSVGQPGEPSSATIDLTTMYSNELASAWRKATLAPNGTLTIVDSLKSRSDHPARIEWRMLTRANVTTQAPSSALLKMDRGKDQKPAQLRLQAKASIPLEIEVRDAVTDKDYDEKNPGVHMIIVRGTLPPDTSTELTATLK